MREVGAVIERQAIVPLDIPEDEISELVKLAARMSGEVVTMPMTPEDIAKYGPPLAKICPSCGQKLLLVNFEYHRFAKLHSKKCKACREQARKRKP